MGYCAICGREHDPDLPCFNGAMQALRDAGIDDRRHVASPDLKKAARLAEKWMMKLLLAALAVIAAIMIFFAVFEKKAF